MPAELSSINATTLLARGQTLLHRAKAFCAAFSAKQMPSPDSILDEHFAQQNPEITEHGSAFAQARLPFIGRTFEGRAECLEYFRLLSETLNFEPADDCFLSIDSGFVVDPRQTNGTTLRTGGVVSVVGHGTFTRVKTVKAWNEDFIYQLSHFDADGKIGHWEIWADPLSAWLAVGGEQVSDEEIEGSVCAGDADEGDVKES